MADRPGEDTPLIPQYSWMNATDADADQDTSLSGALPSLDAASEVDVTLQNTLIDVLHRTHPGRFDFIKVLKAAGQGTVFQFLYHTDDDQRIVAVVKVPDEKRCREEAMRIYDILEPVYNQNQEPKLTMEEVGSRAVKFQKMRLIQEGRFYDELRTLQTKGVLPRKLQRSEDMTLPFLALEFVDAPDFRKFTQTHTSLGSSLPDLTMVCRAVLAIAHALEAFHTAGFVHRDMKSGNVLIKAEPGNPTALSAVLLDLGSAKKMVSKWSGEYDLTSDAPAPATLHATPPEALSGFGIDEISRETGLGEAEILKSFDLYSLGCLLYLGLTNHLPHTDEDPGSGLYRHLSEEMRMLERRRTGSLTPVQRFRPGVPGDLASLTERLLSHLPQDRPRMHAVIDALREQIPELRLTGSTEIAEHTALGFNLKQKRPGRKTDPGKAKRRLTVAALLLMFLVLLGSVGWGISQGLFFRSKGPTISVPVAPTDFPDGAIPIMLPVITDVKPGNFVANNPSGLWLVTTGNPSEWKWEFTPEAVVTGADTATPNVRFSKAGTFTGHVTVANADGWSERRAFRCVVIEDQSPPAIPNIVSVAVPAFELAQVRSLSVTCSGQPTKFEWRLPTEALSPTNLETAAPAMQFGKVGTFAGSVRVGNDLGWSEWKPFTCQVTAPTVVAPSKIPIILSVSAPPGQVGNVIKASATASGDPTQWEWKFPIGPPVSGTATSAMSITFKTPGTYDGFVRAGNSFGWSKWKQFKFTATPKGGVTPPPPIPEPIPEPIPDQVLPVISLVTPTSFACGMPADMSVTASVVPSRWEWKFDAEARVERRLGAKPTVTFAAAGTYDCAVRVGDEQGWSEWKSFQCVVGPCAPKSAPPKIGTLTIAPVLVGSPLTFAPTITGKAARYAWTIGGGCPAAASSSASHECVASKAGSHTATLQVWSESGEEVSATFPYLVLNTRLDGARVQTDPNEATGTYETAIQFDVTGKPMVVRPGSMQLQQNDTLLSFVVEWAAPGSDSNPDGWAKRSMIISVGSSPVLNELKITKQSDGSALVEVRLHASARLESQRLPGSGEGMESRLVVVCRRS